MVEKETDCYQIQIIASYGELERDRCSWFFFFHHLIGNNASV
ncbi:BnaA09g43950D [Brassica napus]|uniref:BnaA09g43950D protein n=1 Tax=Brassica napus TaxID=3708 RepID=A0A078FNG5_BRANA|nr:BnaA09g43950D [Brassica napus]